MPLAALFQPDYAHDQRAERVSRLTDAIRGRVRQISFLLIRPSR
jgi:hypothetical protein